MRPTAFTRPWRVAAISASNAGLFTANWDFHPFGAWLANDAATNGGDLDDIVSHINVWRASNGEEIHGARRDAARGDTWSGDTRNGL